MGKISKAELYRNIARAINHDPLSLLPEFPERFYSIDPNPGVRLYLREKRDDPGVVEYVHENCLANEILRWINNDVVSRFSDYQLDFKSALECARVWRAMTNPIENIKNVAWPGEAGFTFRRMPWVLQEGPYPTFAELMSRVSNSRALMCFIGSLLNEKSDMQQYVWLHGKGENGKGALSRFLHRVFEDAYSSQIPPLSGDKFWTSMILGKRLVVFPDCNNQGFVTSGLFKSLTGGDPVRCEQKQQPAFTRIMTAKYLFLSNERPNLSSERADQRRVIYCEILPIVGDSDPKYEARLWAEGGAFLAACMVAYAEDCPENGAIPVSKDDTNLSDWVSTVEEPFETAFAHNFILDENSLVYPAAFQDRLEEIWPRDRKSHAQFRSWLERKYGIKKRTAHNLQGDPKIYPGVRLIFEGQAIRSSQIKQRELQESWDRSGTVKRTPIGTLRPLVTEDGDSRDR